MKSSFFTACSGFKLSHKYISFSLSAFIANLYHMDKGPFPDLVLIYSLICSLNSFEILYLLFRILKKISFNF